MVAGKHWLPNLAFLLSLIAGEGDARKDSRPTHTHQVVGDTEYVPPSTTTTTTTTTRHPPLKCAINRIEVQLVMDNNQFNEQNYGNMWTTEGHKVMAALGAKYPEIFVKGQRVDTTYRDPGQNCIEVVTPMTTHWDANLWNKPHNSGWTQESMAFDSLHYLMANEKAAGWGPYDPRSLRLIAGTSQTEPNCNIYDALPIRCDLCPTCRSLCPAYKGDGCSDHEKGPPFTGPDLDCAKGGYTTLGQVHKDFLNNPTTFFLNRSSCGQWAGEWFNTVFFQPYNLTDRFINLPVGAMDGDYNYLADNIQPFLDRLCDIPLTDDE